MEVYTVDFFKALKCVRLFVQVTLPGHINTADTAFVSRAGTDGPVRVKPVHICSGARCLGKERGLERGVWARSAGFTCVPRVARLQGRDCSSAASSRVVRAGAYPRRARFLINARASHQC